MTHLSSSFQIVGGNKRLNAWWALDYPTPKLGSRRQLVKLQTGPGFASCFSLT